MHVSNNKLEELNDNLKITQIKSKSDVEKSDFVNSIHEDDESGLVNDDLTHKYNIE